MFTHTIKQQIIIATATMTTVIALAACPAPAAPAVVIAPAAAEPAVVEPAIVEIVTKDHTFEAPAQIEAGWVTIKSRNEGAEPHHVQLLQLNEGVTVDDFVAALQAGPGPGPALALVTMAGGPGPVDPNGEQTVTVELTPGTHLLADFLPGADGVPHIAQGMLAPVEVVAGELSSQAPKATAEVKLLDFSFQLPERIPAGEQVWRVVNEGDQGHEISLIKLAAGKTMNDVTQWMHAPAGAPPFVNVGGMQGIDPGEAAYLHLNLTPGEYVGICHIPDLASGKEHAELGMLMPFTVE